MLGGKMSNADEDEVEDELEAMEAEVSGVAAMPNVPARKEMMPDVPTNIPAQDSLRETSAQRAKRRERERSAQAAEPMLA